jgi:hypothetical protein
LVKISKKLVTLFFTRPFGTLKTMFNLQGKGIASQNHALKIDASLCPARQTTFWGNNSRSYSAVFRRLLPL